MTAHQLDRDSQEGQLTSATALRLLREGVQQRLGRAAASFTSKRELIVLLQTELGASAVLDVARGLRDVPTSPVIDVLSNGSGERLLRNWFRMERFAHTRNRCQLEALESVQGRSVPWKLRRVTSERREGCANAERSVRVARLRHTAKDGGAPHALDSLFVWGLLIGLFERSGLEPYVVSCAEGTRRHCFFDSERTVDLRNIPSHADHVEFWWQTAPRSSAAACESAPPSTGKVPETGPLAAEGFCERLRALLAEDPTRGWQVSVAAKRLGVSTRTLQRLTQQNNTTFSDCLLHARLEVATTWMRSDERSLTEVAFCAGFADLAHFSRSFKRYNEVPPQVFRQMLSSK